jgi:quinol monooxygenase YgiN
VVLVRVEIGDFDRYWSVFSTIGAGLRREYGSRRARLMRNADEPGEVWILFDWDRDDAERFFADEQVAEIVRAAGGKMPPEIRHLEPAGELAA